MYTLRREYNTCNQFTNSLRFIRSIDLLKVEKRTKPNFKSFFSL